MGRAIWGAASEVQDFNCFCGVRNICFWLDCKAHLLGCVIDFVNFGGNAWKSNNLAITRDAKARIHDPGTHNTFKTDRIPCIATIIGGLVPGETNCSVVFCPALVCVRPAKFRFKSFICIFVPATEYLGVHAQGGAPQSPRTLLEPARSAARGTNPSTLATPAW